MYSKEDKRKILLRYSNWQSSNIKFDVERLFRSVPHRWKQMLKEISQWSYHHIVIEMVVQLGLGLVVKNRLRRLKLTSYIWERNLVSGLGCFRRSLLQILLQSYFVYPILKNLVFHQSLLPCNFFFTLDG